MKKILAWTIVIVTIVSTFVGVSICTSIENGITPTISRVLLDAVILFAGVAGFIGFWVVLGWAVLFLIGSDYK